MDVDIKPVEDGLLQYVVSNLGTLKTLKFWCCGYERDLTPWIHQLSAAHFESLLLLGFQADPPAYAQLLRSQINLKHLNLSIVRLTEEIFSSIFKHCQKLETLKLDCRNISFADLDGIQKLRKLKSLKIRGIGQDHQLLRGSMESLEELNFVRLDDATEEFLTGLRDYFPNLKRMRIETFNQKILKLIWDIFKLEKLENGQEVSI